MENYLKIKNTRDYKNIGWKNLRLIHFYQNIKCVGITNVCNGEDGQEEKDERDHDVPALSHLNHSLAAKSVLDLRFDIAILFAVHFFKK